MTIRMLRSEDEYLALRALCEVHGRAEADAKRVGLFLKRPENILLVAAEGGSPIGCLTACLIRQPHRPEPLCFVQDIGIRDSHSAGCVGKALLEVLITIAVDERASEIIVVTQCDFQSQLKSLLCSTGFLESCGTAFQYSLRLSGRS